MSLPIKLTRTANLSRVLEHNALILQLLTLARHPHSSRQRFESHRFTLHLTSFDQLIWSKYQTTTVIQIVFKYLPQLNTLGANLEHDSCHHHVKRYLRYRGGN